MRTVRLTVEFATNARNTDEAVTFAAQSVAMKAVNLADAECVVVDEAGMESKVLIPSFAERVYAFEEGDDW